MRRYLGTRIYDLIHLPVLGFRILPGGQSFGAWILLHRLVIGSRRLPGGQSFSLSLGALTFLHRRVTGSRSLPGVQGLPGITMGAPENGSPFTNSFIS